MYKTAIFDLDGTLLDTLDDLTNAVNYALTKHGLPERTAKEMGKTIYAGAVYTSGGVTYSTVVMNYSMGKYCDTIAGRESSAQRELSKAAAVYGASAKDFFDNK